MVNPIYSDVMADTGGLTGEGINLVVGCDDLEPKGHMSSFLR